MEQLDQPDHIAKTISLTMGAAWASGINLYAAILVLGTLGKTGNIVLPAGLQILMNPLVIGAAGIMYLLKKGLITEEEYQKKKMELLGRL